jgi:RNA polymerase sigma-70 factor (ECF subfamily)
MTLGLQNGSKPNGGINVSKKSAEAEITAEMYDELRRLAASFLRNERPGHTLQRTALVNETYLRLAKQHQPDYQDGTHFLAVFARSMRQTLINHAVTRSRQKRGGKNPLEVALEFYDRQNVDLPALDLALRELEAVDPRQGQIVEMRFFGGLTVEEIADALKISKATVKREWTTAKLWLRRQLSQNTPVNT